MAKPFVKWAGGKSKLLPLLDNNLPENFNQRQAVTYIEPFVGGGAMLFHMIEHHPNINRVIINDINPALINCYNRIQNNHQDLLIELLEIHNTFYSINNIEGRRAFYYLLRNEYNQMAVPLRNTVHAAALFIFFNKTCFNGLYRENNQGGFNVPFGRYIRPKIYNEQVIQDVHNALQNVEILIGDFSNVLQYVNWDEYNFFYFDPPYRPLLGASNFKQYTLNAFEDQEQEALKNFCDIVNDNGGHFMLSNSDSEIEPNVSYFDGLYEGYNVQRIVATRSINNFRGNRRVSEILMKNY